MGEHDRYSVNPARSRRDTGRDDIGVVWARAIDSSDCDGRRRNWIVLAGEYDAIEGVQGFFVANDSVAPLRRGFFDGFVTFTRGH